MDLAQMLSKQAQNSAKPPEVIANSFRSCSGRNRMETQTLVRREPKLLGAPSFPGIPGLQEMQPVIQATCTFCFNLRLQIEPAFLINFGVKLRVNCLELSWSIHNPTRRVAIISEDPKSQARLTINNCIKTQPWDHLVRILRPAFILFSRNWPLQSVANGFKITAAQTSLSSTSIGSPTAL